MTTVTASLVEGLLYEHEGTDLDFKRSQYPFARATDEQKAELLKDILAFANAWRRADAFILTGVEEVPGGRAKVVGVTDHIDDATLQQFVSGKTNRPVPFSYAPVDVNGLVVGVIHIPLSKRPYFLKKAYGGLKANVVYLRRGSSTAEATPDEISDMGAATAAGPEAPILELRFASCDGQDRGPSVSIRSLKLNVPESLPDYEIRRPSEDLYSRPFPDEIENRSFYRELAAFESAEALHEPLWFAIRNRSQTVAEGVRILLKVDDPERKVSVLDRDDWPKEPEPSWNRFFPTRRLPGPDRNIEVKRTSDGWTIEAEASKVRPKENVVLPDRLGIGALATMTIHITGKIYADNLPEPVPVNLAVSCEASSQEAPLEELRRMEADRFYASPKGKAFLELAEKMRGEEPSTEK